jgi:hypothetical protein
LRPLKNIIENQLLGTIIAPLLTENYCSMYFDFSHFDLDSLKTLYERENEELQTRLLNGAL